MPEAKSYSWKCLNRAFTIGERPLIMGIVNVTPDSFSDGGQFAGVDAAIDHAEQLIMDGADILDIGGESTRPGAEKVSEKEELRRVIPVIESLTKRVSTAISIDTSKAEVAKQALAAGACIINDVTGLQGDEAMPQLAIETGAGVIVMHMKGDPRTMQLNPVYEDVVGEVDAYFKERLATLTGLGMNLSTIALDPGVGFGKRQTHTLQMLGQMHRHAHWNLPICLGVSRKGFINKILNRPGHAEHGDHGTVGVLLHALSLGQVQIARVHNVKAFHDAMTLFLAMRTATRA